MGRFALWVVVLMTFVAVLPIRAIAQSKDDASSKPDSAKPEQFKPEQQASKGSVTVGGSVVNYDAYASTLVVHTKDWDDVPQNKDPNDKSQTPGASMFCVAYFKSDTKGSPRPVTFLYNGGPGSLPCGCTWGHLGRSVSSLLTTHTRQQRHIR